MARGVYENWDEAGDGSRNLLLECTVCNSPFLASRSAPNRNELGEWDRGVWSVPYQMYPSTGDLPLALSPIPGISKAIREAHAVFNAIL